MKPAFFTKLANQDFQNKIGFHYIGIVCIIAWYYSLWFTPPLFKSIILTDDLVTYSWLATLAASGICLIATPIILGEKRHLDSYPKLHWIAGIILAATTIAYTLLPNTFENGLLCVVLYPILFGIGNAILWIIWGEFYAIRRTGFSSWKVAPIFGIGMLGALIVAVILPGITSNIFVALLPLASCALLDYGRKHLYEDSKRVARLPKKIRNKAFSAMLLMCGLIFGAGAACYYLIAIIPLDTLPSDGYGYPCGIALGTVILIAMALYYNFINKQGTIYRSIPWLLVACTIANALYLSNIESMMFPAFLISVSVVGVLEVLLITYFGTLSTKGYITAAMAFGFSSGCIRLGFFAGDGIAVTYEHFETLLNGLFPQNTALIFICLLAVVLIPMLRQEQHVTSLMDGPSQTVELSTICEAITSEFKLSARESEILGLIAKGYTVDSLAKKLVISPYTAQTHVRHIYAKMQIHKRSELLDYINMHRTDA